MFLYYMCSSEQREQLMKLPNQNAFERLDLAGWFWAHKSSSERTFQTLLLSCLVFPYLNACRQEIPAMFVNLLRGMVEFLVFEILLLLLLTWGSEERSVEENVKISLSLG